ncbi:MAG: acyl-CoA dehydrogenase family protein [Actinomycetota bacterium]|nr:acyl-CoA dehydrogenase family protein [Actinomycetota bacterium]MDD5667023.1 acyl-CoA dehydrogenase family protein [Actinomycetota bacterium]
MVDFELTEEQKAAVKMAHDFALNEMRPVALECDKEGTVPESLVKKAAAAGLTAMAIPEEYGGGGLDQITASMVSEELAWGCAGIATTLGANSLATTPMVIAANEEQKKEYFPRLCDPDDPKFAAFCLTEPGAGSDAAAISTIIEEKDDHFILNGQKCFITNGGIADFYSVFCTFDKEKKYGGIGAVVVERSYEGVSVGKHEDKMGIRASDTSEVIFDNVKVPKENLFVPMGQGFYNVMTTLDLTRASVAALATGVARAAFEEALKYSKERVQFGRPIIAQQSINFMLAEMAMKIEAGRRLYQLAAWKAHKGLPCSLESSYAKAFCGDMAMEVTVNAVQVHGGYGYMKEYLVEKLMRDAKIMQIYEGTAQIQRLVIGANLMGVTDTYPW